MRGMTKKILISTGEASGDSLGANLLEQLKKQRSDIHVKAMGGKKLAAQGAEMVYDSKHIAVMGIIEVIKRWSVIKSALQRLKDEIDTFKPDLLIVIDYVEFNLKLAKYAKSKGVKVLFYVSPQVWAWRSGRVPKIGKVIDVMAVLFPFETRPYEAHNVPVRYVGHPLIHQLTPNKDTAHIKEAIDLNPDKTIIGILPGSRRSEVERISPCLVESMNTLNSKLNNIQFVIPVAPTLSEDFVESELKDRPDNTLLTQHESTDVIQCCDAVIVASGTATLEVSLLEKPMCIVYKTHWLTYLLVKYLLKIEHVGLANIVAGKGIVPEFIQGDASATKISDYIEKLLTDLTYREKSINKLKIVRTTLSADIKGKNGGETVAELANELLNN